MNEETQNSPGTEAQPANTVPFNPDWRLLRTPEEFSVLLAEFRALHLQVVPIGYTNSIASVLCENGGEFVCIIRYFPHEDRLQYTLARHSWTGEPVSHTVYSVDNDCFVIRTGRTPSKMNLTRWERYFDSFDAEPVRWKKTYTEEPQRFHYASRNLIPATGKRLVSELLGLLDQGDTRLLAEDARKLTQIHRVFRLWEAVPVFTAAQVEALREGWMPLYQTVKSFRTQSTPRLREVLKILDPLTVAGQPTVSERWAAEEQRK